MNVKYLILACLRDIQKHPRETSKDSKSDIDLPDDMLLLSSYHSNIYLGWISQPKKSCIKISQQGWQYP